MNKMEFMRQLKSELSDFRKEERDEILYDYEEHFRIGEESGKSEEELIRELGNPRDIADQYRTSGEDAKERVNNKRSTLDSVVIFAALLVLNLIIVWPFIGIIGGVIGIIGGCIGIFIGGIAMIFGIVLVPFFPQFVNISSNISKVALVFAGIGTTTLGILFGILAFYILKFIFIGIIRYIKWCIRTVRGE